jgi:hypothetical protein
LAATLVETNVTDIAKELKSRRAAQRSEDVAATPTSPDHERTPELEALATEFLRKHRDEWIDTKVPALGNRTPRQAAKTPRGRERLEALLSDYERTAVRNRSAVVPDIESGGGRSG